MLLSLGWLFCTIARANFILASGVRLVAGLDDTLYRVVERESVSRALCKRGVGGRQWNVSLEVANATYLNLDMIELSVASMARRWSSR